MIDNRCCSCDVCLGYSRKLHSGPVYPEKHVHTLSELQSPLALHRLGHIASPYSNMVWNMKEKNKAFIIYKMSEPSQLQSTVHSYQDSKTFLLSNAAQSGEYDVFLFQSAIYCLNI